MLEHFHPLDTFYLISKKVPIQNGFPSFLFKVMKIARPHFSFGIEVNAPQISISFFQLT